MRLKYHCDQESVYSVAKAAGVNSQTVFNFLKGETWGDVVVLFRLEHGLRQELWSHAHLSPKWDFEAESGPRD